MKLNKIFIVGLLLLAILAIGAANASEDISDDIDAIEPVDDVIIEESSDVELDETNNDEEVQAGQVLSLSDFKDELTSHKSEINLENDYRYDSSEDEDFTYIETDSGYPFVLNGNNHTIDGQGKDLELYLHGENTIKNIVFKNFRHSSSEPFLYYYASNCKLENCTFENIYASGKLVKNNFYYFSVDGCTFKNNTAGEQILYNDVYESNLTNCNFINNTANYIVYMNMKDYTVDNCNFTDNCANKVFSLSAKNAKISNCNFINNDDGGDYILDFYGVNSTLSNFRFDYNDLGESGKQLVRILGTDIKMTGFIFEGNSIKCAEGGSPKPILQVGPDEYGSSSTNNISVTDSSFKNNQGLPILWNSPSGNIIGCTFTNNNGTVECNGAFSTDDEGLHFRVNVSNSTVFGYDPSSHYGYEVISPENINNTLAEIKYTGQRTGNIVIYLNGVECYKNAISSNNSIDINSLDKVKTGMVDMVIKLISGEFNYEIYSGKVFIDYTMKIDGSSYPVHVYPHEDEAINVYLPRGASGTITLNDGSETHALKIVNGKAVFNIDASKYKLGTHSFTVSISDDSSFYSKSFDGEFIIEAMLDVPYYFSVGEKEFIYIDLPDVCNVNLTIYNMTTDPDTHSRVNDVELVKIIGIKGLQKIPLPELPLNASILNITFSGDWTRSNTYTVVCIENSPGYSVSIDSDSIELGNDVIVRINVQNSTEIVQVEVDGNGIGGNMGNTTYVYQIPNLSVGDHQVKVLIHYQGNFRYSNSFQVTVKDNTPAPSPAPVTVPAKIVAKDYSAYYNKGTYSVTVYGTDGKVAKGVAVVFKINGKKVATVKTDSKGVAKLKIADKYIPKKYKISATALGKTETKNLVVKQVLTLKKVTVKKSAKKLVITATLKEGKKAIKGKKITFIFNKKKYTAKTNKKGIAKVTIKKAVLKKLKKGKKVTYKATYLKDTVKRTVKVKK